MESQSNRRASRNVRASLALIAVSIVVGGCGTAATPQANVPSGPAAEAGAICSRVNSEIAASKPSSASMQEIIRFTPKHVAIENRGLAELSRLTPPASLAHSWTRILDYRRRLIAELTHLLQSAQSNDASQIKAVAASKERLHQALLTTAQRVRLYSCGLTG